MSDLDDKTRRALLNKPFTFTETESSEVMAEIKTTTANDFDNWILGVIRARNKQRVQSDSDYKEESEAEAQAKTELTTADDYDNWVLNAIHARDKGRVQLDSDGREMEHPTAKAIRTGVASIRAGKPSEVFLLILEEIANRAETHDVLHLVFPNDFPKVVRPKTMQTAKDRLRIVNAFRKFVELSQSKYRTLAELKSQFKIEMGSEGIHPATVDRAFEAYDIDFAATPGPKTKIKPKQPGW